MCMSMFVCEYEFVCLYVCVKLSLYTLDYFIDNIIDFS